jgi:serine/threonine-protein kinase HipA
MLKVFIEKQLVGSVFQPESDWNKYQFRYEEECPLHMAVSLTMPVVNENYASEYKTLHPIFDMNLPEGALADRLRREFSKVIANFDALAMLKIVGQSQVGRLRFAMPGETVHNVPEENLKHLLAHDGAEGLFESLMNRYAVYSGISGAMPKIMLRDSQYGEAHKRITHKGSTHIVKAWTNEFPRLAENEYFCMRAAFHSGLTVANFELSKGGKFFVVERFDVKNNVYLGLEDFCVLNGKTSHQKYDGSYEGIAKRIKDFVSAEQIQPALESFFKALVLSCALKNGDAHLKNFAVIYDNTESTVSLSPIYDIVTTTAYLKTDILALTLGGTKRWPKANSLISFARSQCNLTPDRAKQILNDVAIGMAQTTAELDLYMQQNEVFREVGTAMLAEWEKGLELSVRPVIK